MRIKSLTAERLAALQRSSKLRPHIDEHVLRLLQSLSALLHCSGDH